MKILAPVGRGVKALRRMVFRDLGTNWWNSSRWGGWNWSRPSGFDYAGQVGDGTSSSTVMAPLLWIARTFPEAPPAMWQTVADGQERQVHRHRLLDLLQRPNGFYTGPILWMATMIDYEVDGNAYWIKIRNGAGVPEALWWAPSWMLEPRGDSGTYLTHYLYQPRGVEPVRLAPEDVVHFRFGLDPDNDRKGYSPLKSVLREVFTDDEAAAFTATLLRNAGVPGLIVSPKPGVTINPGDAQQVKADLIAKFTGDRRGEPIVMGGATDIAQFGFSPEQLLLRELRRIPEERVTAVLGVPAIVAGLGAGLDRSTFTNMGEAREAAYESGIIPTQRILAEDIRFQLLPDFEADPFAWRFGFDLSKVRVLQVDEDALLRRMDVAVRGGWGRVNEARRAVGLPADDTIDDVYLRQVNVVAVPVDGGEIRPMTGPAPPSGNGNGAPALNGADPRQIAEEVVRAMASP